MSRIARLDIAGLPPEDRALAHSISESLELGDPDPKTLSSIELERAWAALDQLDAAKLPGLIRLSDRLGVAVPEAFRPGAVDALLGPPRPDRRTRIVATVGPASADVDTLAKMIAAGMDVARLNFSHIHDLDSAKLWVDRLEAAMEKAGRRVEILADLRGPKLRIGDLAEPVELTTGAKIRLGEHLPLSPPSLLADLKPGERLFIDDGKIELVATTPPEVEVVRGGTVSKHKGLNLPDTRISEKVPTEKDLRDIAIIEALGITRVAVSFVEDGADMDRVRSAFEGRVKLIAKIERPRALENIESIFAKSDGLMVARGDGAVEMGDENVPVMQNRVHLRGNKIGVPTGTATQMMESMLEGGRPSRSDVSDVARAALEGSDFVMTSGETATGQNPVAVLGAMSKILATTERAIRTGTVKGPR